jgi:superfamily II DNA or RNA helicase
MPDPALPLPQNPLIVQGDHTVLLEVDHPLYPTARDAPARFAELVKSPEHIHTYRLTPLSIWNACAVGETAAGIVGTLQRLSKYPPPGHVATSVRDSAARYGCLQLTRRDDGSLLLSARDLPLAEELAHQNWGLIIYDEVHLLPAPVFQITASLQARRRLGLTATLVREDGKEDDVFALIGPKKYDVPWKEMEQQGWIATAICTEIRLPMTSARRMDYAVAEARHKFRIASENPTKLRLVRQLLERHRDVPVLIIGMYVEQVEGFARELGLPLLTGSTNQRKRDEVYASFRLGTIRALVVSKIANFSVDLPDAAIAIQISGMYGSRQEEAQRLGRILRPKPGDNQAYFYSIVSRDTVEQDFALKRQLFLCEQGYEYRIITLDHPDDSLP